MPQRENEFNQPIGNDVPGWVGVEFPSQTTMTGNFCRIEALSADRHTRELFNAYSEEGNNGLWTYMPHGPFDSEKNLRVWMESACKSKDPLFFALIEQTSGKAVGMASYLRITPQHGVIEVGNIAFAPQLQKTPIATEAMFLMMQRAFNELGYRRYEWKCDALNAPSCRAAERLGFHYDGLFKQAVVYKGRNRDTAWFSILDSDWPRIERGFTAWLAADNFDAQGIQQRKLAELIAAG